MDNIDITNINDDIDDGNGPLSKIKITEKEIGFFGKDKIKKAKKEVGFFGKETPWHAKIILNIGLWAMFCIAAVILIFRSSHFIIPVCWRWLTPDDLQNIDKFLFSGAFGGILAGFANYLFKQQKEKKVVDE